MSVEGLQRLDKPQLGMSAVGRIADADFAGLEVDEIGENEIERLAAQHLPIILPWSRQNVRLGTCYQSCRQSSGDPWVKDSPFVLADLYMIPKILEREHGTQATYKSVSTTRECESGDHLSLGFGVGVGLPFLASISVKGTYDKDVQENKDVSWLLLFNLQIVYQLSNYSQKNNRFAQVSEPAASYCRGRHG